MSCCATDNEREEQTFLNELCFCISKKNEPYKTQQSVYFNDIKRTSVIFLKQKRKQTRMPCNKVTFLTYNGSTF